MINFSVPLKKAWRFVRELSGDNAYEHYLEHWHQHHSDNEKPMDRKTFYRKQTEHDWNKINRCC